MEKYTSSNVSHTRKHVVDYLRKKEILYLGPDKQIVLQDIDWIVARASKRGFDTSAAFMPSKPIAGINHQECGVTSEGVNRVLLRLHFAAHWEKDHSGSADPDGLSEKQKIILAPPHLTEAEAPIRGVRAPRLHPLMEIGF